MVGFDVILKGKPTFDGRRCFMNYLKTKPEPNKLTRFSLTGGTTQQAAIYDTLLCSKFVQEVGLIVAQLPTITNATVSLL